MFKTKPPSPESQRVRWFLRILGIILALIAAILHLTNQGASEFLGQVCGAVAILLILLARFTPNDIIMDVDRFFKK